MKVLLVRPQAPNILSFTKILDNEPLELEYLYTSLRARGIDAVIFDGLFERDIEAALRRENPQVVAVTGYITQQELMKGICRISKAFDPKITTIVGGVHAQLNYAAFYDPAIDYIYRSECVWDFAKFVRIL